MAILRMECRKPIIEMSQIVAATQLQWVIEMGIWNGSIHANHAKTALRMGIVLRKPL